MEPTYYIPICPVCKAELKMRIIIKPVMDVFKVHEHDWLDIDDHNSIWQGGEGP